MRRWLALFSILLLALLFVQVHITYAAASASAFCGGSSLEITWNGFTTSTISIFGVGPGLPAVGSGSSGSITRGGPGTWIGVSVSDSFDYILLGDFTCPPPSGGAAATSNDTVSLPDDRINPSPVAPVAIYCRAGGVEVYIIDRTGRGQFAFAASQAQINAVGVPSANTLIASGAGAGLYRLTSGEFQVNSTRTNSTQPKVQAQETGQTIIHTVQRGENLFRIAIRYGTTVAAISQLNGIADPTRIFVGQQLTIVVGSRVSPPSGPVPIPLPNQPAPPTAGIGSGYVFVFGGC